MFVQWHFHGPMSIEINTVVSSYTCLLIFDIQTVDCMSRWCDSEHSQMCMGLGLPENVMFNFFVLNMGSYQIFDHFC